MTWEWDSVPEDATFACGGVCRAAIWLLREVGPVLRQLHAQGVGVVLAGHSLGAAVASLLCALLRPWVPDIRCLAYGCPAVMDAKLADSLRDCVTTIALHDDVIPRLSPVSIRAFTEDLLQFRERVFQFMSEDWKDLLARASGLWSPRTRTAAGVRPPLVALLDDAEADGGIVLVTEPRLADVWLPGRIWHIFSHRGVYRVVSTNRAFGPLRRIVVQGNIFTDHKAESIAQALLELRAVRQAVRCPPEWVPFTATEHCQRCNAAFTWASTCRGQAQELKDRHNCRCCGGLVCGPCSNHFVSIPALGLIGQARVCDACFHGGRFM